VYSPHTTCAVLINERERGFARDFNHLLDRLAPVGATYAHDDLESRTENLEDDPHEVPNGHAHCRGALLGSASEAIPIVDGRLLLGRWQRVFLLELDRARQRKVFIQVMGE
ncbi:MAG TPA: secondary thiamine-phosphate synthase enzyme YjbQ, partial [Actinomycetota bacterium]